MIYLVEDDDSIRELVVYTLRTTGFEAKGFSTAALFWEAVEEEQPELVLLDIMLPDEDGLHILKRLRSNAETADLPVIMLTAKSTEYDRVLGLDSGADDYIPKPFGSSSRASRRCCAAHPGRTTRRYTIWTRFTSTSSGTTWR